MVLRFGAVISGLVLAYSLLFFRLYELQIAKGGYYLARAESQHLSQISASANRGIIYFTDRNGNKIPATLNKNFPLVYAVPRAVEDPSEAANILSGILNKSADKLLVTLSKPNDSYEVLLRKTDSDTAKAVDDLGLKGIYTDTDVGRYYPFGAMASQVLGYVGPKSNTVGETGYYGVEGLRNSELAGAAGSDKTNAPQAGADLILTIDPNIQSEGEEILANLLKDSGADGGNFIVEDPQTGKILAMGSLPDFDPNNYGSAPIANFLNPAVQQIYEPGSVFKVLTMATGIDAGKITPDTTYVDTGSVTMNGRTIQNYDLKKHGPYGKATMTNVIEHSINTGAVFAERQIGRDIFTEYMHSFGFADKTGIDLPGELKGDLRRLSPKEKDIAFATASYGQGVAVTPIELINAITAIANGGNLLRPYIDASLAPKIVRRVITESTARAVTGMMISAVDKAGVASVSGYSIAGKTGSAYIPDFKNGGYTDKLIDSYAGFGPTNSPRFVILFKVNGLDQSQLAATIIVPAFREMAQFILNYYGIAPDRIGG